MEQLQQWLKCRGIKQSRKRCDLVTRIHDSLKSGNHVVLDPSIDNGKRLQWKILKEYNDSVLSNFKNDELNIPVVPESEWKPFPSQNVPLLFNYGRVYHYHASFISLQSV